MLKKQAKLLQLKKTKKLTLEYTTNLFLSEIKT